MKTLVRYQFSALLASIVDLLVMIFLVEIPRFSPGNANILGNVSGGIINFFLNKGWTFSAGAGNLGIQAMRYIAVWIGYIGIGYATIVIGTEWLHMNYLLVKIASSVALGILYNFMLHKHFVYR